MSNWIRLVAGAAIAIVLLGFYALALTEMTNAVIEHCKGATTCTTLPDSKVPGNTNIVNLIGGLVSALVVSVLGVSQPGTVGARLWGAGTATGLLDRLMPWVTLLYVLVWLWVGVRATYVGLYKYYEILPALSDFAATWLGLAVAAVYVFFGLNPRDNN